MKKTITEFLNDTNCLGETYGFYDWFCEEGSLKRKAQGFVPKLKFLIKEEIINPDTVYVWFKNNCPVRGALYDDMRISDLNGNFLGGFTPRTGHQSEDKTQIWVLEPYETTNFKNWTAFKKEVQTNKNFKAYLKSFFYVD